VLWYFLPVLQVVAHSMHYSLSRFASLLQMGIMPRVKDMVLAFSLDDATCENEKILLFPTASWQHLAMLSEMDEIPCAHLVPWNTLAMVHRITPVV